MIDFIGFPKINRLKRICVITEKLDGTNAQIVITKEGGFYTGSRNRWITPENDNYGFSKWAHENREELMSLGVGQHFGEWWGQGIQRRYRLDDKRFSLFNVHRWDNVSRPSCCSVVPTLFTGDFSTNNIDDVMEELKNHGSYASEGFMNPEGIIVFHSASRTMFKRTFEHDEKGKPSND